MEKFLERNPTITLVNGLPLCEGSITRKRISNCLNEESILDLFMVCERVLPHVVKMHVDEKGENQLTHFYGIRNNRKVTETDHAKLELELNIKFEPYKPTRRKKGNIFTQCFPDNKYEDAPKRRI